MVSENEIRNWVIYKITNPINQVYIGKTCDFKSRINHYKTLNKCIRRQRRIYESLINYGYDAHSIEVVEEFESTISFAHAKEIFWVRSSLSNYNTYPDFGGLNLGNGGLSNKGIKHTDEMNLKKSIRFKGRKMPQHQIDLLKEMYKGAKSPMNGKNHTEESRLKMSKSKKGMTSPNKGNTYDIERCLLMSSTAKNRISKLKGRTIPENILAKMRLTRNTKKKSVLLLNSNRIIINEFDSVRKLVFFLNIGESLVKRVLGGFNNNQIQEYIIKYKQNANT